ncbi:MAG: hypothetical protein EBR60_09955 [Burkholderiaceae bacterium]|nr:hypothetical protein [Burkholderiaceae bacterium]
MAFILHELGHAWYTQNAPWDSATKNHGQFVSALINGLEDPRIELAVIKSGRANNSKSLFVELVNNILRKDGYVKPNDLKNVPFMLAIEGRRLNGYPICFPEIVSKSNALIDAQNATDTADIVSIAIELNRHLHNPTNQPNQPNKPESGEGSGENGEDAGENGEQSGEDGDGDSKGSGEQSGEGKGKGTGEDQSARGEPNNPDGEGSGEGSGESDKPTGKQSKGKGKGGRNPEPNTFIESELGKHSDSISESNPRPAIGKPTIVSFNWGM